MWLGLPEPNLLKEMAVCPVSSPKGSRTKIHFSSGPERAWDDRGLGSGSCWEIRVAPPMTTTVSNSLPKFLDFELFGKTILVATKQLALSLANLGRKQASSASCSYEVWPKFSVVSLFGRANYLMTFMSTCCVPLWMICRETKRKPTQSGGVLKGSNLTAGHGLSSFQWAKQRLEDDWPESIFPQVLIQLRRHLFTSLRRACLRAAMLSVYGHMRAPSHHPTFLSNCAARFLTKVICASCIVPGCCVQVALCKLLRASALCKLLCASALSKLLCASALRQLLRASALRMCSAQVGLCKLLCACSAQVALRKCSEQVALRKGSAPVAPCKRFAHVLCATF